MRRQQVSAELQERLACREQFSFPIEPNQREWPSRRPGLRVDPPSASVPLPAAARGGFNFVRHNAKAQTSGPESVEKNVNFYQLERAKSTSREMTGEIAPRWPGRGKRGPGKGFAQCSLKNIPSTRMYVHNR